VPGETQPRALAHDVRADVRSHDDDRVAEIDRTAQPVRQAPFFQDLQQHVHDSGCAFSISSNSTTEYGRRRTRS
jgi:hypothetical protein